MPHINNEKVTNQTSGLSWLRRIRRIASSSALVALLRSRTLLTVMVVITSLLLIILHGLQESRFRVDQITLGLLAFLSLPFMSRLVTSFKAGNVEVSFRDMSVHDQLFTFLDGVATKRQWTFFTPRSGEEYLGPAFATLTEQLLTHARERFIAQLRSWLVSDDLNQRWFASEIIGFHKVQELRHAVGRAPETKNTDDDLETWELNCLWAKSRFDEIPYRSLKSLLLETESSSNQVWILRAFKQMIEAKQDSIATFLETVRLYDQRQANKAIQPEDRELITTTTEYFLSYEHRD